MIFALLISAITFEARMAILDARLKNQRYEIWLSERRSWQRIIALNEARFGEGVLPERDLIQARLEGGILDLEVSQSKSELEAAKRRLTVLLQVPENEIPDLEEAGEPNFPPLPGAIPSEIEDAAREYETAREQIQTFRLRLLAPCEESASIEELLYEQLKTTLLALIESRRTCRDIRLRYEDALYRAEASRLRLRELLGREDFLS